jgi:kynurenine formamidase
MRVIDLTIPLNEHLPFYPTDPPFRKTWHVKLEEAGVNVSRLELGAHAGTHVDVPLHFLPDGADVATLPPAAFMGEAIVIDARKAPGEEVTPDDIDGVDIRADDIVLFYTGWEARAGTPAFFTETWPGVTPEVVCLLISKGVKAIGGDFPSIDSPAGIDAGVPAHKKALGAGLPVFEALVNLAGLAGTRFQFIGLPLRIEDGEASPIRAVAVLSD